MNKKANEIFSDVSNEKAKKVESTKNSIEFYR